MARHRFTVENNGAYSDITEEQWSIAMQSGEYEQVMALCHQTIIRRRKHAS